MAATALLPNVRPATCLRRNRASDLAVRRDTALTIRQLALVEQAAARKSTAPPRLIELDILRGFLLLWMTFTHLPSKASVISNQTFGFVSGAEGFIFLAGFMIGQLEHRIEQKSGHEATVRDILKRTARVYAYHVALLTIAFTVFAEIAARYHRVALQNLLSFYFAHPKPAVIAALILQYRPSLLDILPMYVIFLVLTLVARRMARRVGWDPVVYISFGVWAIAQFGLRAWLYRHVNLFGLGVPEDSTGAFDMYAWQLLWIVGLALGSIYSDQIAGVATHSSGARDSALPPSVIRLSVFVALGFLFLRYSPVDRWINPESYGWLIDKWHLGPARVINFSALAIVLVRYGQHIASFRLFQPLAALGRASIAVFSVHVLCCFVGDAFSISGDPDLPWWQQSILLLATVFALFATAQLHQRRTDERKLRALVTPS